MQISLGENATVVVNWERVGIIFFGNGGYHAYWLRYSEGLQCLPNGKFRVLWCKPKFQTCDLRAWLKRGIIKQAEVKLYD